MKIGDVQAILYLIRFLNKAKIGKVQALWEYGNFISHQISER